MDVSGTLSDPSSVAPKHSYDGDLDSIFLLRRSIVSVVRRIQFGRSRLVMVDAVQSDAKSGSHGSQECDQTEEIESNIVEKWIMSIASFIQRAWHKRAMSF